ncbi:MAG: DUF1833 family protein [Rickettsia sp.]|nr:DUF1833 family protein [Rickettsia sp.]
MKDTKNAGEKVTFKSLSFELSMPPVNNNPVPEIQLRVDNVSLELIKQVEKAIDSAAQIEVIYSHI